MLIAVNLTTAQFNNSLGNHCNNNTTSRHVVSSFYHGNSPIFSVLCYYSTLFHPAAGQSTLASDCAKTPPVGWTVAWPVGRCNLP